MARRDALLRLHKSLSARRAELRKRLGREMAGLGTTAAGSGDSADAAFDASGEELSSQLAELEAKELSQVERALHRLKSGTYGLCEACTTKIPVARLNALPYSTLCIKCQRDMESDVNFWASRGAHSWDKVSDEGGMEDREVDIADLEMDLTK